MSRNKSKPGKISGSVPPLAKTQLWENTGFTAFIRGKEPVVAFILISTVAFFIYRDFLLFNKVMLYKDIGSDTLNGFYPFFTHTADYIHTSGTPSWSFNIGMGQNIYPFCFRGPVDAFLYLFGKNQVAYAIGYIEFFKVIAGGMIFFYYLRTLRLTGYVCIVGSLLFSFSGFMVLGGTWYIFSSDALMVALLLLAFEKLFKNNSWPLFPVAIAVIGMVMPFNLYLYGVFLLVYATFRFFEEKKEFSRGAFLTMLAKMGVLSILGLLISSVFLFENVLQLLESPRGSGGDSYFATLSSTPVFSFADHVQNVTSLMRLFSNDLLGSGSDFKGWMNYLEAPMFYSGLIALLLFPQAFAFSDKRRRIIYSLFFLVWALPVVFPFLRYALWLFTGNYYRGFSFFVSLTLLYISMQGLNNIIKSGKINLLLLAGTTCLLLIMLSYPYFENNGDSPVNDGVMGFIKIFLVIYSFLLAALKITKVRPYVPAFLLGVLCVEAWHLSDITVNRDALVKTEDLKEKTGYNDYSVEAVDYIKKKDRGFFRVDKNYSSSPAMHSSLNDGMVQDYYGTSAYSSFNQVNYILFLQAAGVARKGVEEDSRWANGLRGRPVLESMGSVKYLFSKNATIKDQIVQYDSIAKFGDVTILQNKYFLPLGFTYDHWYSRSDFDRLSNTQKDFTLLKAFFVQDNEKNDYPGFPKFDLTDTLPTSGYTWDIFRQYTDYLKKDTLTIVEKGQTFFKGTISLNSRKLLFLSIPFDKGWKAFVNGTERELKKVDAGMTGLVLEKGENHIELKYTHRFLKKGLVMSLLALSLYVIMILAGKKWRRPNKTTA